MPRPISDGLGGDLGRYIGFGGRPFLSQEQIKRNFEEEKEMTLRAGKKFDKVFVEETAVYSFLTKTAFLFAPESGVSCFSLNSDATLLCQNQELIKTFDLPGLMKLAEQMSEGELKTKLLNILNSEKLEPLRLGSVRDISPFAQEQQRIQTLMDTRAIQITQDEIKIPYRLLIPFNLIYNRTNENRSSYYTDIGFIRLIVFGLLAVGWIASIPMTRKTRNHFLTGEHTDPEMWRFIILSI